MRPLFSRVDNKLTSPPNVETAERRSWHRLHLSTWIITFVAAVVLVLIIVPGEWEYPLYSNGVRTRTHGWPWPFFVRSVDEQANNYDRPGSWEPEAGAWRDPKAWTWFGEDRQFSAAALAGDLAVAAVILTATAFGCEFHRRRRGRFLQYTLREALLTVTVVACVLSWWSVHHRRWLVEADVKAALSKYGFHYFECYIGPTFLHKLLGYSPLEDFYAVDDCEPKECFSPLAPQPVSLAGIERFTRLRRLIVCRRTLADADFQAIGRCASLTSLLLSDCEVSDKQLSCIALLPNLRSIQLMPTNPLSANGVRKLLALKRLEWLNLNAAKLTGDALEVLGEFPQLQYLDLTCVTVVGKDSASLGDKDIERLAKLHRVPRLDIRWTQITPVGLQQLKKLLPNCKIIYKNEDYHD